MIKKCCVTGEAGNRQTPLVYQPHKLRALALASSFLTYETGLYIGQGYAHCPLSRCPGPEGVGQRTPE